MPKKTPRTTKRIKTPDDMPTLGTRVGAIKAGRTYELPVDIADDLVKTRGCKPAGRKAVTGPTEQEAVETR